MEDLALKTVLAETLKKRADGFNALPAYEKFLKTESSIKMLNRITEAAEEAAKKGCAGTVKFLTYRYDDPNKDFVVKFFKELGYKVTLEEEGKPHINPDYKNVPYRQYKLIINWN